LCIKFPWPGIARTIGGTTNDIKKLISPLLSRKIFYSDGAYDEVGYYKITGRVDDVVIVSGHTQERHQ
jgi:acetyl-CoA synthetase